MYQDFDNRLVRERTARMREEVERIRLDARLARTQSDGGGGTRRSRVARGAALVTALFGYPLGGGAQ